MSKADGWKKVDAFEWIKASGNYRAEINKCTGGAVPYYWSVYPLPRADHIGADGRYRAFKSGSNAKLADAKRTAELAVGDLEIAIMTSSEATGAPTNQP